MEISIGSIILLLIAIASGVYWFILKKQIDEEENRVEPSIDRSFAEFNKKDIDELNDEHTIFADEEADHSENNETKINYDLFEDSTYRNESHQKPNFVNKVLSLFKSTPVELQDPKRAVESLSSPSSRAVARPAPVRTVALILQAPEDQPYLGKEVLEVGMELQLMIGREGFLEHLTTTYFGDEPMYSIAHLLHPGSFNDPDILDMELPGLLFFAHIPGPDPKMNTIQHLLTAAATYGQALGGTLLNDRREPVDSAYVDELKAEIEALDQKIWAELKAQ